MTGTTAPVSYFPGGTSISRLKVYPWVAPDGLAGGTPHLHTLCSEAYVVVGGQGRVQTLSAAGYTETVLEPSSVVWFGPGVIHRPINDGGLRLLVIMQNSGLPEAGDAVMIFPLEYLNDPQLYGNAATLAANRDALSTAVEESARERQALAVTGFTTLRRAFESEGPAALNPIYAAARSLVAPRLMDWRRIWEAGAMAAATQTDAFIAELEAGVPNYLTSARVESRVTPDAQAYGMCGYLDVYHFSQVVARTTINEWK